MATLRRRRLRFRLTAAFALAGLVIPATLSAFTYFWARTYLVDQRESSAVHQTEANAVLVGTLLRSPRPDLTRLVSSLQTPSNAQAAVYYAGSWFGTSPTAGPDSLPAPLVQTVVNEGKGAHQRFQPGRRQEVAVGIPLGSSNAYFEIFSMADLTSTLATLRYSLAAGSLLGFLVSLAIGAWGTRRALRPLRDISSAAASIASGRLDARLDAGGDQELFALATGFNAMVDTLQKRIERDARFASDVSHELRSPLTTLHSAVEVMRRRRAQLDARSGRALDLLGDEVGRFEQLVEDLLEISRYDAGVAALDLEPVDVASLTSGLLAEARQKVDVSVTPGSGPADAGPAAMADGRVIMADRRRLEQALRNLIRNAVIHAGGVAAASVHVGTGRTTIAIEDRGPGIPACDRDTVFERFARGRAAGRRSSGQGVGLGLALVAEHVGLQDGEVRLEDVAPTGCRFVIDLPTRRP
ncbi:MAG TPA: HAMP domain-containing sensor histidine kinase [Acidimicrobiales bacterium]|nr:HAMP domain-containing sensor histidine kinase [Acidimicrobiales bacterium]